MKDEDFILCSRVCLSRNIKGFVFPHQYHFEEGDRLAQLVLDVMKEEKDRFTYYRLRDLDYLKQLSFLEDHRITPGLFSHMDQGSFFLREDRAISVMVGEEDHLVIQGLLPGLALTQSYYLIKPLEERLDQGLGFSFDRNLGFLTACPSKVGTGLTGSLVIHLPALEWDGMEGLERSLTKLGFSIHGVFGEESKALGSMFEVSNEKTLGEREESYLSKLEKIGLELVEMEKTKRKKLYFDQRVQLEDRVYRSFGTCRYSKKISYEEAMDCLSMLKLGLDLSLLKPQKDIDVFEMMRKLQNATMQIDLERLLGEEDKEIYRGKILNRWIKEVF